MWMFIEIIVGITDSEQESKHGHPKQRPKGGGAMADDKEKVPPRLPHSLEAAGPSLRPLATSLKLPCCLFGFLCGYMISSTDLAVICWYALRSSLSRVECSL